MLLRLVAGHNMNLLDLEATGISREYPEHFGNQQGLSLLPLSDWHLEIHRVVYKVTLAVVPPRKKVC